MKREIGTCPKCEKTQIRTQLTEKSVTVRAFGSCAAAQSDPGGAYSTTRTREMPPRSEWIPYALHKWAINQSASRGSGGDPHTECERGTPLPGWQEAVRRDACLLHTRRWPHAFFAYFVGFFFWCWGYGGGTYGRVSIFGRGGTNGDAAPLNCGPVMARLIRNLIEACVHWFRGIDCNVPIIKLARGSVRWFEWFMI